MTRLARVSELPARQAFISIYTSPEASRGPRRGWDELEGEECDANVQKRKRKEKNEPFVGMATKTTEVELELHELSEDDDEGFDYGGVVLGEDELLFDANDSLDGGFALGDAADEDLETTLRSLRQHGQHEHGAPPPSPQSPKLLAAEALALDGMKPETATLPCVIDDFLRNFFIEAGMVKTLEVFDGEWYSPDLGLYSATDPDIYQQNASLKQSIESCRVNMEEMAATTEKATGTWDAFRKERDFHRTYHKKVLREKKALMREMAELKVHFASEGPMIEKLTRKREGAMKDKMLLRLESDRLKAKARQLEEEIAAITGDGGGGGGAEEAGAPAWNNGEDSAPESDGGVAEKRASRTAGSAKRGRSSTKRGTGTQSLSATLAGLRGVPNRFADVVFEPVAAHRFMQSGTIDGHRASVAAAAFHPRKAVLCTASDDMSWRMWKLPEGTALMSGKGHTDWVSDVAFHPEGDSLASASGDGDVRLWDFKQGTCAGVLKGHSRAVWSIAYHHSGGFLASASMDHSLKLWDLSRQQCAISLRGHVDSVNSVCFKPFSSTVCSASGDKTISLWDARSGLCSHTFYGHANAVNHCTFQLNGASLARFFCSPRAPSRRAYRRYLAALGDALPPHLRSLLRISSHHLLARAPSPLAVRPPVPRRRDHFVVRCRRRREDMGHKDGPGAVLRRCRAARGELRCVRPQRRGHRRRERRHNGEGVQRR